MSDPGRRVCPGGRLTPNFTRMFRLKWEGDGSVFSQMLNNLDSQYVFFKGPAGLYGCLEAFLPTMGVFFQ